MNILYIFIINILMTSCFGLHTHTFYLDSLNGIDSYPGTCSQIKPCKTLGFAWDTSLRATLLINGTDLYGNIEFLLKPGIYDQAQVPITLTFSCSVWNPNITTISIKANPYRSSVLIDERPVQINHGFRISSCTNVVFDGVELTNIKEAITLTNIYHVYFVNTVIKKNIYKPILYFFTVNNVIFENISISLNEFNLGQDIPQMESYGLEFHEVDAFNITNLHIEHNNNLGLLFRSVKSMHLQSLNALQNKNFSILFYEAILTAVMLNFTKNYGNTRENGFVQLWNNADAVFENMIVSCNRYTNITVGSVIQVHGDQNKAVCNNCKAIDCPVYCDAGQEVTGILCNKCPLGSSSKKRENQCRNCSRGYYAPVTGSTNCSPCLEGTYCSYTGCSYCKKCNNDLFSSTKASSSCSQMSTLFIVLLVFIILLIFMPLLIWALKKSKRRDSRSLLQDDMNHDEESIDGEHNADTWTTHLMSNSDEEEKSETAD